MLQHVSVGIRPQDGDAEVRFWEMLGFEEIQPPPGLVGTARWVAHGGEAIHLQFTEHPVFPPVGHVAIVTDDYQAALQRLEEIGIAAEPRIEHWGSERCYLRTPAGHLVELMATPPRTG